MFKYENTHSSRRPLRANVPQGSTLSPLLYSAYINDLPRPASGVQLALFADDTVMYMRGKTAKVNVYKNGADIYVSCLTAYAALSTLHKLQVLQNRFCRAATNAHWCVKKSVLHRDLELTTILKHMKYASARFFSIVEIHPYPLLSAAVFYEAPPPYHLIRRPRIALTDSPDALTAEFERIIEINKQT
ncbi:Probable RNA-directed DNA polymerase from transposon X-element [Eumeta japonica]|uniref:Probable RNA-directed DNA polymerase from transposon X-element n=1 Tax=Eumeta variegata TaxID=151549 RepID=A0A4C1U2Z2_EUMVA|nr:Probable RNA-directed DNA polymerase from transposon X-element [Eumeta japonica]